MWIAVFGGLSPLRGPLATASAMGRLAKGRSSKQGPRTRMWDLQGGGVSLAQFNWTASGANSPFTALWRVRPL